MPMNHSRKATEIDAQDVRVRFSPAMKARFARLEAVLKDSEHFSDEMAETLRELAAGKEMTVFDVMADLAIIVEEAAKHNHVTGDDKAHDALRGLIEDLSGMEHGPQFTLIREPTKRRGQSDAVLG
jgi:hypothetical protein